MKKKTAINNLKFNGWAIFVFGILGVVGTLIYWKNDELIGAILKLLFSIIMIYFGWEILTSLKILQSKRN